MLDADGARTRIHRIDRRDIPVNPMPYGGFKYVAAARMEIRRAKKGDRHRLRAALAERTETVRADYWRTMNAERDDKYLSSHARAMRGLKKVLGA